MSPLQHLPNADIFISILIGWGVEEVGHFAGTPMVANRRGVGVKNRENLTTSLMDGPLY